MACCPFHDDRRPSFGISTIPPHVANCFVCGGISLQKLVAYCKGFYHRDRNGELRYDYKAAENWLRERYNVTFQSISYPGEVIPRYDEEIQWDDSDEEQGNKVYFPEYRIAKYSSGRSTHEDFFARGFTEDIAKAFGVGYDNELGRITIPIRWRDGSLAGLVGRSTREEEFIQVVKRFTVFTKDGKSVRFKLRKVLPNPRWYFYWNIDKAKLLFPLDKVNFNLRKDVKQRLPKVLRRKRFLIICEGVYDAMRLHQFGLTNSVCIFGSKISDEQVEMVLSFDMDAVVSMLDGDEAGYNGTFGYVSKSGRKIPGLVDKLKKHVQVYVVDYPPWLKDPGECSEQEIFDLLSSANLYLRKRIDRVS